MDEWLKIIRAHAARYPRMEPQDAVKLAYQSAFGGGHLIRDEAGCLARLREEYGRTPQDSGAPLSEDIGGGLCRLQLRALDAFAVSPETACRWFIDSARETKGSRDAFLARLDALRSAAELGVFSFSAEALASCLAACAAAGYPAVSHSAAYRAAYAPAYRVIRKACLAAL